MSRCCRRILISKQTKIDHGLAFIEIFNEIKYCWTVSIEIEMLHMPLNMWFSGYVCMTCAVFRSKLSQFGEHLTPYLFRSGILSQSKTHLIYDIEFIAVDLLPIGIIHQLRPLN
jgi:hypothetical protein